MGLNFPWYFNTGINHIWSSFFIKLITVKYLNKIGLFLLLNQLLGDVSMTFFVHVEFID